MEYLVQTRHAGGLTGKRSVARVAIALSLVCAMGGALGQSVGFQSVPEFEAWIAEAEKVNKDPVDWALDKGKGEDWASKLDAYLVKRELARADGDLARAKAEGVKLGAEVVKSKASLDKTTSELVASYARLLTIFESMKTRNSKSITSVEIEKIRRIYRDTVTPPEMRRRIELQFGSEIGASFRR